MSQVDRAGLGTVELVESAAEGMVGGRQSVHWHGQDQILKGSRKEQLCRRMRSKAIDMEHLTSLGVTPLLRSSWPQTDPLIVHQSIKAQSISLLIHTIWRLHP